jgi:hypothetical protein
MLFKAKNEHIDVYYQLNWALNIEEITPLKT